MFGVFGVFESRLMATLMVGGLILVFVLSVLIGVAVMTRFGFVGMEGMEGCRGDDAETEYSFGYADCGGVAFVYF